ncbi:MAG: helix-turn-helix transcriptional regulator [Verrucomicrobia bacterium]|nr:helix-turn-helix transcriptional regulator [Verrucomicrobiota bacterium]
MDQRRDRSGLACKTCLTGRNWSQSDLAARLGVSRQTVNAIETERYDPSLPLAFKVARVFKRPIEEIFFAVPDSTRG